MGNLADKVAIITGAGQGVGRGIALALAKAGASVVVVGRTLEKCIRMTSDSPDVEYMINTNPEFIHTLTASTSLKRLGSSEMDVGRTVVFLSSPAGDYITGQTINVDGGIWIVP